MIAFVFICVVTVQAQVQTARYVSMIAHTNAYYEYLPQGYPEGNTKYPLILFLHGTGEAGQGTPATLPNVLRNGPPKLINNGTFPTSFTVNGSTFKFIVISPQFTVWPTEEDTDSVINYLLAHYPIDINRVYLTGLSMGGGTTWNYSGININHANRLAAIVPVCGAGYPYQSHAHTMAAANLPVWATHNSIDNTVPTSYTIDYVNLINTAPTPPNPLAKKTIFPVASENHDAWTQTYDPAFKENNMNIYEWMLQYRRFLTVLPVTGLTLNVTQTSGSRVGLQWTTLNELNNTGFTILRSNDGINFTRIATISSTAINGAGANYGFTDNNPLQGLSYYRLEMQDVNGNKTYSDIKQVRIGQSSVITVYPNPASAVLNISSSQAFGNATLRIINSGGQVVQQQQLNGSSVQTISISKLSPGIYYAEISDGTIKEQFQFMKR